MATADPAPGSPQQEGGQAGAPGSADGAASGPGTPLATLPSSLPIPNWAVDEAEDLGAAPGEATQFSTAHDVALRMEVISNGQCKVLGWLSLCCTALALMTLAAETVVKFKKDPKEVLLTDRSRYFISGLIIACVMLAMLLFVLGHFARRLWVGRRTGRRWTQRRRRASLLSFAQLATQTTNVVLWLTVSALVVDRTCEWSNTAVVMLGWAQWTLWNCEFLIILIQGHGGNQWYGGRWCNLDPKWARRLGIACAAEQQPQEERLILDAPMTVHLPKLVPWALLEVAICLLAANLETTLRGKVEGRGCDAVALNCTPDTATQVYVALMVLFVVVYLVIFYIYLFGTFRQLATRSYQQRRMSNMLFRIQAQQVSLVFGTLVLSMVLLLLIKLASCWTFVFTWFGVLAMHITGSSMCLICSWYFMPTDPRHPNQILRVWLQEFAWTAASLPARLEARNQHLKSSAKLRAQPMFCLEMAMKLAYWSELIYYLNEVEMPGFSLDCALELMRCEGHSELWDRTCDMRALLGWNRRGGGEVVITFRGTASFENVMTDLKLWQAVHPPKRRAPVSSIWGLRYVQRVVKVHSGFYEAWAGSGSPAAGSAPPTPAAHQQGQGQPVGVWDAEEGGAEASNGTAEKRPGANATTSASGQQAEQGGCWVLPGWCGGGRQAQQVPVHVPFKKQLLGRVDAMLKEAGLDPTTVTFYITGHSLGGSIASLAALDLRRRYPAARFSIYTFGQPRLGNRPFAAEYNSLLPDHWSVVCGQDPVPRVPKSGYKRIGHRVIVNAQGDLVIKPTFLETSILKGPGVVNDHFLERYRASFAAVIKSQFSSRQLPGGAEGVVELSKQEDLDRLLACTHLDMASLRDPDVHPITLEALEKQQRAESSRLGLSPSFLRDTATRMGSLCCAGHPARDDEGIERVARLPGAVLEAVQAAVAEEPGPAMAEASKGPVEACGVSGGGVIEKAEAAIRAQSMPRH